MVCIFSKLAGVRDEGFHTSRMISNNMRISQSSDKLNAGNIGARPTISPCALPKI